MNLFFKLSIASFFLFSVLLIIGIPVSFVNSGFLSWKKNKKNFFILISLWLFSVFLVGILNSFVI
uniref:Photosystem II reaction center protein Z n=1 Tax=Callipsygma wilsonis TaxID=2320807 RepID=A0A386B007_9CHLO|nr:photosystem II protein Z [Callipsygma wilsonis]AYC65036.1 photosystem II protein Z [Callipsygma wilsonis]